MQPDSRMHETAASAQLHGMKEDGGCIGYRNCVNTTCFTFQKNPSRVLTEVKVKMCVNQVHRVFAYGNAMPRNAATSAMPRRYTAAKALASSGGMGPLHRIRNTSERGALPFNRSMPILKARTS